MAINPDSKKGESEKETRMFVYKQNEATSDKSLQVGSFVMWKDHPLNGLRIKDDS